MMKRVWIRMIENRILSFLGLCFGDPDPCFEVELLLLIKKGFSLDFMGCFTLLIICRCCTGCVQY